MNKQLKTGKSPNGEIVIIGRGIEWTDQTWNVLGGCEHDCEWQMPDGSWAECYAKSVAERLATAAYPHGFKHHYFHPERLEEPIKEKKPSRIFLDSMSDLMGNWVPAEQIEQVLDVCRRAHWHSFQSLTKNAPRYLKFTLPENLWAGVSAPPTRMFGKELTSNQQRSMVLKQLDMLLALKRRGHPICWMSIEPLSFDIAAVFNEWLTDDQTRAQPYGKLPLDWAVIGAASNGNKLYQPRPNHVEDCHVVLRANDVKIFHKGNLKWEPHLEEFPAVKTIHQEALL